MTAARVSLALILTALLVAAAPAAGRMPAVTHVWKVTVAAPAQFDLALAEVRLRGRSRQPVRMALAETAGLLYVAGAAVLRPPPDESRALVLLVNRRPRGSLAPDRLRLGLRVSAARQLGMPHVHQLLNPFTRRPARTPALCDLELAGGPLAAGDLRPVLGGSRSLGGFTAAAAVAEAYDVVCGLPFDLGFARVVQGGCTTTLLAGCCPPNALCATPTPPPTPTPTPTPMPGPGCPPCPLPPCQVGPCPLWPVAVARLVRCPLTGAAGLACY